MAQPNSHTAILNKPVFDQPRAEAAIRELLYAIGEDPDRHGLVDTPARVARSYQEMFAGLYADPDAVLDCPDREGERGPGMQAGIRDQFGDAEFGAVEQRRPAQC